MWPLSLTVFVRFSWAGSQKDLLDMLKCLRSSGLSVSSVKLWEDNEDRCQDWTETKRQQSANQTSHKLLGIMWSSWLEDDSCCFHVNRKWSWTTADSLTRGTEMMSSSSDLRQFVLSLHQWRTDQVDLCHSSEISGTEASPHHHGNQELFIQSRTSAEVHLSHVVLVCQKQMFTNTQWNMSSPVTAVNPPLRCPLCTLTCRGNTLSS